MKKTIRSVPIMVFAFASLLLASPAFSAEAAVDLKNDTSMAVAVPLGTDNGVDRESDFQVTGDNVSVTIYPQELYDNRFWSQPLSEEAYVRVRAGMSVRPVTLDKVAHAKVRVEGKARLAELRAKQEEARRQVNRKKIEDLKEKRERLLDRRFALDDRIAAAEKELADEEGRLDWLASSADTGIDRSLQAIQDLADKRDELQAQRDAISRQSPSARGEIGRLTAEIKRLSDRISSERENIRIQRDRKRSARSSFLSVRQDWQKLVADRNAVTNEIRSIDQKIKDLSARD